MTKTVRSALVALTLISGTVYSALGASSAQSSAFGEYVTLDVLPFLGSPVHVISGPLPSVSGSAPPAYANGNTVASATVSSGLLNTILQTGVLTVNAASGLPATSSVSADATVNNTTSAIAALLGLTADVIKSNVSITGACGNLTTTGTTTLVNAKLTGLLGVTLPVNPAPNTVVLNLAGVKVVLNEQISVSNGVTTGLTVNAIHITLTKAAFNLGLLSGQIIISQSQGSMQCTPPSADITLTKTASPSSVTVGNNITYTLTALNHGPDTATNVMVSDTLPSNVTLVSVTPSQGHCTGTTAISCNLGSINSGATGTITIVATAASGTSITNSATVTSDVPDKNPGDNTSTVTTPVTSLNADLGVTKTASPSAVNTGGNITYTLTVVNRGPDAATNTSVTDTLPANVTLVSITPSTGQCTGTSCSLGTLNSGASATITIVVTANSGTSVTNSASVTSSVPDKNTADNSASVTTPVNPGSADLGITKTSTPSTALTVGQNVTYTMQITNAGPSLAPNTIMTDTLPAEVTFVSVSTSRGSCSGSTTVVCNLGSLSSGGSATVTIVGKANSIPTTTGRRATNTATVKSDAPDPNLGNNTARASNEIH